MFDTYSLRLHILLAIADAVSVSAGSYPAIIRAKLFDIVPEDASRGFLGLAARPLQPENLSGNREGTQHLL